VSLNKFRLSNCIVSYSTLKQAWEVIIQKDELEISYRWFYSKEKAEHFALNETLPLRNRFGLLQSVANTTKPNSF
jgi:hypothetical protein